MYELKLRADGDTDPNKVDLGVGIYRNEQGLYHELKALKDVLLPNHLYFHCQDPTRLTMQQTKDHLAVTNPNHDVR
jgi:aspartate/tyrosine/aromatic aminotransferase